VVDAELLLINLHTRILRLIVANVKRRLLIDLLFDAARFRENCFCVVFICGDFTPPLGGRQAVFVFLSPGLESPPAFCRAVAARSKETVEKWAAGGRAGAHLTGAPRAKPAEKVIRADGSS
jgi:hypothetical protein